MKQGTGNNTHSGYKTEPVSKAVNPAYAADIGIQEMRTRPLPMYEGRGLKAPMQSTTTHKSGSQGEY